MPGDIIVTSQHATGSSLRDRYEATAGRVQLTGIQALARLPIEQHRRDLGAGLSVATFISGYEGSPLAGYDLELGRIRDLLELNDIAFVPGLNEEAAATAIQGTQLVNTLDGATRDGVLGIWYGKAPGLDRATDAMRHGNLMGSHPTGGALVLVGDDPGAKSSSVPCSSESALSDLAIPFLYPADSADVIRLGLHAIEVSRATGLWVGLKIVTSVADGSSTVELSNDQPHPRLPAGAKRHVPTGHLLQPTLGPLERDQLGNRLRLAREYSQLNDLNEVVGRGPVDRLGVVAAGRTWLDVLTALEKLGVSADMLKPRGVRLLRVGMPYPLSDAVLRDFAAGLDEVVVVEEKRSFMETAIREALYGLPTPPRILGKRGPGGDEFFPEHGELDVDLIVERLASRLFAHELIPSLPTPRADVPAGRLRLPLAVSSAVTDERRVPYFCSGCPHNSSTKPVEGSLVGAGIGCHAMVLLMDPAQVGSVTGLCQMGGEGLQWIGMAPFTERGHFVQNLGDGTFDHSGSLAIRAAVAAGVNITYKLLYNSAVAMTGGQQAVGAMRVPQIVDVLRAEGVSRIVVTTEDRSRYRRVRLPRGVSVRSRTDLDEVQRELAEVPGVTVLIHDQECATESRRRRRRAGSDAPVETRVMIDERVCEGCGDCGRKSNCLSVHPVETDFGRKTQIHQSSCNLDESCLEGDCPAFLTVRPPRRSKRGRDGVVALGAEAVVDPPIAVGEYVGVRLAGIGGTGVVTVSQVLAMAGLIAGWDVRSLDQTGLAQKGGAVVSDVRFRRAGPASNKLAAGECDLFLGCDLLVAADRATLAVSSPARTTAVLSTSVVPTGRMVSDVNAAVPDRDAMAARIGDEHKSLHVFDARGLAVALFGDDQYANMLVLGAGFQTGALPIPATAIEEAIRLNGVAVELNLQAFRRGRQRVADPRALAEVEQAARSQRVGIAPTPSGEPLGLDELVAARAQELTAYQDAGYASRFEAIVESVRRAESGLRPGSTELSEVVARHLFKLMAYKDEYEVARLLTRAESSGAVAAAFGPGAHVSWNLHPPALRAIGVKRKLRLGRWFVGALIMLRGLRRLRGTRFDPFGRAQVRRIERELIEEYVETLEWLSDGLTSDSFEIALRIAQLPDMVRGYEEVKLATVDRYRSALHDERQAFVTAAQRSQPSRGGDGG